MSSLFKITPFYLKSLNYINYKKTAINVIIIYLIVLFSSCDVAEKAEKERLNQAFSSVSIIPPTEEDSEFFNIKFEKKEPPQYPF